MKKEDDYSYMGTKGYFDDVKDCLNIAKLIANKCQDLSSITTKSLEETGMDDLLSIQKEILFFIDLMESNKFSHIMKMDESTFLFYKKYKTKMNNLLDTVNNFIKRRNVMKNRFINTIYGGIIGDAMGVPVEFTSREMRKADPVTDMIGYGTYPYSAGTWSDDTSMTLCLIDSIAERKCIDYENLMQHFSDWLNYAKYTSDNIVFDIGRSCRTSILNYWHNIPALECGQKNECDNGNGSLMRISSLPFYLHSKFGYDAFKNSNSFEIVHNVSSLTHGHSIALIGCDIYCSIMLEILNNNKDKSEIQKNAFSYIKQYVDIHSEFDYAFSKYNRMVNPDFRDTSEDRILSSGYIVDTLEAAFWSFLNTDNYKDCVLKAVNLGEDTDTVACIAGSIAGAYYNELPSEWKNKIRNRKLIDSILAKWEFIN